MFLLENSKKSNYDDLLIKPLWVNVVREIPSEICENELGSFLKISIEGTCFYIPGSCVPGGLSESGSLVSMLANEPTYRVFERLLTPLDLGGLEARIDPSSEIVFIEDQPLFHSFSFDEEFSIERRTKHIGFDPHGKVRINLYLEDSEGFEEKVIAVEFDCDYPLVAELMSPLHPNKAIRHFLNAVESATDAKSVAQAFQESRMDSSWVIGLPSWAGGISTDPGSIFLGRVVELDALNLFHTGDELLRTVHLVREGKISIDAWVDQHRSKLSDVGLEASLGIDIGL